MSKEQEKNNEDGVTIVWVFVYQTCFVFAQELLDKCHPLGMFDSISTLAVASNMRELYRLVLVDTPLAPYFADSLTSGPAPLHAYACKCLSAVLSYI